MWGSNPYWQPEENEGPRTERVLHGIRKHVKGVKNVIFVVMKSWNDNAVLYEWNTEDTGEAVKVSWLSLEEEDIKRHVSMGNDSLRSTLNPAEDALFGCSVNVVEGDRFLLHINHQNLAKRTFEIVLDSAGQPAVIGYVNGVMCRLEHAYVQMKKGPVPDAEYMNFYGRSLKDGTKIVEKIFS
jgi:hypothetical protein